VKSFLLTYWLVTGIESDPHAARCHHQGGCHRVWWRLHWHDASCMGTADRSWWGTCCCSR